MGGGGGGVVPPSPALVRHGSKQHPAALTPGGHASVSVSGEATPLSAAAQMNVPVAQQQQRRASQQQPSASLQQHPYANASAGYDSFGGRGVDEYSASQQPLQQMQLSQSQSQQQQPSPSSPYGRVSPMVSSVAPAAPPALSHVRAMGGEVGMAANGGGGELYRGVEEPAQRSTLWKILTCRCG